MTTFIEFHVLRSFPPSNLNRDDLGTPKTALFGGSRRLRISSQCLKRTWRTSEHFRGGLAEDELGIRTNRLPEQVLQSLGDELDDASREGLVGLLASIGKKGSKGQSADDLDDEDEFEGPSGTSAPAESRTEARTAHLLFLSRQEIEAVANFARAKKATLGKVFKSGKKKSLDNDVVKKLRAELESYLGEHTSRNAVDIGLFGRFVTSSEIDTIDAALQVAHGLGTQKIEVEYDYFTAVDDLGDEPGAGHLGESEFTSSVIYLYACCDFEQLGRNLGSRTVEGRVPDSESIALARRSLPMLVRAMAEATPKGKRTGTAPHTPAEYVEVVVRKGSPMSYANAFCKPVSPRESDGDVMAASISRLAAHRAALESAYGRNADIIDRFILCLRETEDDAVRNHAVPTIEKLAGGLRESLDRMEVTISPSQSTAEKSEAAPKSKSGKSGKKSGKR